ncbi:MAG: NAD(P)/FAD-dependent oxidoreductase [Pseudolabrys sp.]|nr:NAD(P)/FAD-dependent oxidoreductase [Pseudolabrys sp.]
MDYDCLIIGGGPAGLTAATYLGRFRRKVLVIDAGDSRALQIPESHNYPGFADGIAGPDLLREMRQQATQYGAEMLQGTAEDLVRDGEGYALTVDGRSIRAPRILLATGLKDHEPDMPGLKQAVANTSIRYCPVCDAYEATDKNIAVYGSIKDAEAKAVFMRTYSKRVTLLPTDKTIDNDARERMAAIGVTLASSAPVDLRPVDGGIVVQLLSGEHLQFDVIYPVLGCEVRSDLATALGAKRGDVGCVIVDDKQRTTVENIFAAGDVVSDLHQLSVAAGYAAIAATAIHASLPKQMR